MRRLRSGTAVFSTGSDGRIEEWNREAEHLTGISAADAEGRFCWDVIAGRDADGGIICHPGCSAARLAREDWPVRGLEVIARFPVGAKRLILSTIVVQGDDGGLTVLHPIQEASDVAVSAPAGHADPPLTRRQREILLLLAHGVRAKEIAERLMLSETTVRNHIQAILVALGVHSQLEAAARAHTLALVDDESAA